MLPSPRSSLSSFRDYCPPTPEYEQQYSHQCSISLGFRNFLLDKLFQRIKNRLEEEQFFTMYQAFRFIEISALQSDKKMRARRKLDILLVNLHPRESNIEAKRNALKTVLSNASHLKSRQEQFCVKICLLLSAKLQNSLAYSLHQIQWKPQAKSPPISKDHATYILRLSRAQFSILVRNILMTKLYSIFEAIRSTSNMRDRQKQARSKIFAKQKKQKHHEHKVDTRVNKLANFMTVSRLIEKKIHQKINIFWLQFIKFYRLKSMKNPQNAGDSATLMNGVVQHMIYITGKLTKRSQSKSNAIIQALRALKLKNLFINLRRRERKIVCQCIQQWRGAIHRMDNQLAKQIERLELIKKEYVDES